MSRLLGGRNCKGRTNILQANIAIKTGKTMGQQCGSSILDKDHILTAAHCFKSVLLWHGRRGGTAVAETAGNARNDPG